MKHKPIQIILSGPEEVAKEAANRILERCQHVLKEGRPFRIVLSGGSTPRRLYQFLVKDPFRSRLPWDRIHFFWGDERSVAPDHPDSNYRMVRESLFDRLQIPEANIHRMKGETSDPHSAARDYERRIREHFGLSPDGPPPCFDVVLLGMGTDGHTASLFPKTQALRETQRWVVANFVPKLEAFRLTLTSVLLNQAASVLFLVTGADKADTLAAVIEGPSKPEDLPSQLICPVRGELLWLMDKDASRSLRPSHD
jgi:6-phosphogluconolactonase